MSLSANDLIEIRNIIKDELKPLGVEIIALRNDIKEVYSMIHDLNN